MRTRWTKEEMESTLIQLDEQNYLFKGYRFSKNEKGLILLGSGGYSNVYEMKSIENPFQKYAVKVLGFGDRHIDSYEFIESIQVQQELACAENDVVEIINYVELCVDFDESAKVNNMPRVIVIDSEESECECIKLQFILMEKLMPVLTMDKGGRPKLFPKELAGFWEKEIMKLAHNIGKALERAHKKRFLHRDIKLENVFYDPEKKVYKLGDFGIAKKTEDGMASTVAFTKGYGAPEVVGAIDERYDDTADIYSFGIMLYLLLNELKFPDSENYNVNVALQYSKGYQFPAPEHEEYALCSVIDRMCQYNPDERFQSMEAVMNVIEDMMSGRNDLFKKGNAKSTYVLGMVCYIVGIVFLKLTHMNELKLDLGLIGYAFAAVCIYTYWLNLKNKEHYLLYYVLSGLGIIFLFFTGFTWWKLLIVISVSWSTGSSPGIVGMGMIIIDGLSKLMSDYQQIYKNIEPYKWFSVFILSYAIFMLLQHSVLMGRDLELNNMFFKKQKYWIFVFFVYGAFLIIGERYKWSYNNNIELPPLFHWWRGIALEYNFSMIGICGLVFSIGGIIRGKILKRIRENNY